MLEVYDAYKSSQQNLIRLMKEFEQEVQLEENLRSQMMSDIAETRTDILIREKNVQKMEVSIRKHLEEKTKLQDALSAAVQGENTRALSQQLLQEELNQEQKLNEELEQKNSEMKQMISDLEKKVAELSFTNQKLTKDKSMLLQAQFSGGNV